MLEWHHNSQTGRQQAQRACGYQTSGKSPEDIKERVGGARSPWKQAAQSGAVSEGDPNRCVHGASVKSTNCDVPGIALAEFLLSAGKYVWKDC